MKTVVLKTPTLQYFLTMLRDKNTDTYAFRNFLELAGYLMTYEVVNREISPVKKEIETVFEKTEGVKFTTTVIPVMILRAAVPFCEGAIRLLDELRIPRKIGVVDAKRIEESSVNGRIFDIAMTSFKVPKFKSEDIIIIYDPMIATASTMIKTLHEIYNRGNPRKIIIVGVIAAKYGVKRIESEFKDKNLSIYVLAVDDHAVDGLNDKGYIVPGLGDCGDRAFGT